MIKRNELTTYLKQLLPDYADQDYCPNGLQVAGSDTVARIVCGVSANQALIDAAIAVNADAIIVHHGFFWKGEDPCLVGIKARRIASLIKHNISCFAYHLPLDCHPSLGNNALLGKALALGAITPLSLQGKQGLAYRGVCRPPLTCDALADRLQDVLQRAPQFVQAGEHKIEHVAWCTGAGQDGLEALAALGVDAYITGEISERTPALAKELGVHFFAAGHHATEVFGVRALGEQLALHFDVAVDFIDVPNEV